MNSPHQREMLLALITDTLSCLVVLLKKTTLPPSQKDSIEQHLATLEPILNRLEHSAEVQENLKAQVRQIQTCLAPSSFSISAFWKIHNTKSSSEGSSTSEPQQPLNSIGNRPQFS